MPAINRIAIVTLNFTLIKDVMTSFQVLSVFILLSFYCASESNCLPVESEDGSMNSQLNDQKGILDGLSSTTAAPGGLPGLPSLPGGAAPMMVVGAFQGIVTKMDPSQGLPGLPSAPIG